MSESNRFGKVVTAGAVRRAVVAFLNAPDADTGGTWLSTCIGEIERTEGLAPNSVQRPNDVISAAELEKMPEDQLPLVLVMCPGLARPPERKGRGVLTFTWTVGVAGVVSDTSQESSRLMGEVYAAAISLAVNTRRSLGGFASQATQTDERYDDIDFSDGRTLGTGHCTFEVAVDGARPTRGGPAVPLADPGVDPGPWPAVTEASIDVDLKPITEDVTA